MSTLIFKKNFELSLPTNYAQIDNTEMEYVDGGSTSLRMSKDYLSKDTCRSTAYRLILTHSVHNMSQLEIAQEIYGHAVLYYASPSLINIIGPVISYPILNYIRTHGNPIDIADGGDTKKRKAAYTAIWTMF